VATQVGLQSGREVSRAIKTVKDIESAEATGNMYKLCKIIFNEEVRIISNIRTMPKYQHIHKQYL
jgi:hypothetical protein